MKLILALLFTLTVSPAFARKSQTPAVASTDGVEKISPAQNNLYYFAIANSLKDQTIVCQRGTDGYQYYLSFSMYSSTDQMHFSMVFGRHDAQLSRLNQSWQSRTDNRDNYIIYVDRSGQQPVIRLVSTYLESILSPSSALDTSAIYEFAFSTDPSFSVVTEVSQYSSQVVEVNKGTIINPSIQRQRQLVSQNLCRIVSPMHGS